MPLWCIGRNKTNMKKISIIVPIYNCEKYIESCIESIVQQSYPNIELILVNDGSKDETGEICQMYADKDSRIQYLEQKNRGVSAARNHGIEMATGEFLMFVDADDVIMKDACERLASRIEDDTDMILCGFRRMFYRNDHLVSQHDVLPECKDLNTPQMFGKYFGRLYETTLLTSACAKMYRSSEVKKLSPVFCEDMSLGEDALFNLKFLRQCGRIAVENQALYVYNHRSNVGSLTKEAGEYRLQTSERMLEAAETLIKEKGIYMQAQERVWKVYYKDCMNYLERVQFSERRKYVAELLERDTLIRILKEEKSKNPDLRLYHFFLGSRSTWLVSAFAEVRKTAKRVLRGGN